MNVPAMLQPMGAFGNVTAPEGHMPAGSEGVTGLGELFSLQFGFAMQNLQTSGEEGALIGQGLSEEEQKALEALMALMQQLAAMLQEGGGKVEAFLTENGTAIEQLTQKLQAPLPQLNSDWEQLLNLLKSQDETAANETQKLVAMIREFLLDKEKGQDKPATLLSRQDGMPVGSGIRELGNTIQPLRAQQGLTAYKQEAAIQAQSGSAQLTAMLSPEQTRTEGSNRQPLHTLLTASDETLQTSQSFRLQQLHMQTGSQLTQEQPEGTSQQALANPLTATAGAPQSSQTIPIPDGVRSYPVPADQLPEQVTRIFVKQMNLSQVNGLHQAKLILHPESLGQVNVTITSENGVITAHFTAETRAGKEMLDNQLFHLRTALTQNGLQVDRLEVIQQPSSDNLNPQQQREQAKQQQDQQPQHQKQQEEQTEFVLESLVDDDESVSSLWDRLRESSRRVHDLV